MAAPDSTQAMAFDLLQPFLDDGKVDRRLLTVLGIVDRSEYTGTFDKVVHPEEGTSFAFHMESPAGRQLFLDLKLSEESFGGCDDDPLQRDKLEHQYRPYLCEHVDAKWLEAPAFCANYRVLRNLSYLGRYPSSGVAFVFPKTNAKLMAEEATIKQIVSKSLAPRVAIFYLEYLVERVLEAVADDPALTAHYRGFRARYIGL